MIERMEWNLEHVCLVHGSKMKRSGFGKYSCGENGWKRSGGSTPYRSLTTSNFNVVMIYGYLYNLGLSFVPECQSFALLLSLCTQYMEAQAWGCTVQTGCGIPCYLALTHLPANDSGNPLMISRSLQL